MAASGSGWESLLLPMSSAHSSSLISPMPRKSQTQPGESVSKPLSSARDRNVGRTPSCRLSACLHQWHRQRWLRQVLSLFTSSSSKVKLGVGAGVGSTGGAGVDDVPSTPLGAGKRGVV